MRLKEISVFLLLLSVLWLFTNSLINRHKHRLPSGLIIEHAHPYFSNNLPIQQHRHTQEEYFYFDQITALRSLVVLALLILIAVITAYAFLVLSVESETKSSLKEINRLRPPPVQTS